MAIEITTENFEEKVIKSDRPVMVDFWAPWCGPCRMLGPVVEEFSNEQSDILVGKVNVDENPALATKYSVMTIPTLILFKDGEAIDKSVGVISKEDMEKFARK